MANIYRPFPGDITRVHGIRVGQAQNAQAMTGVTVVLPQAEGAVGGVSVRGAAPGTRETDLLRPGNLVENVNAVVLSGGSAYGLAAATGVMAFLEKHDVGLDMGVCRVPIVPAAVLYDLAVGDAHVRPDAAMGAAACRAASKEVRQGAGTGATVGKLVPGTVPAQSGVGTASIRLACGVTVGAIAAVNACGDVFDIRNGKALACGHLPDGQPVLCESLLCGAVPVPDMLKIPPLP